MASRGELAQADPSNDVLLAANFADVVYRVVETLTQCRTKAGPKTDTLDADRTVHDDAPAV
ncbi:hypothetical protein GCM10023198_01320 [Promicromonospora umidemergens]|uniref:Uncharacterized protein n=1 Tax=Promicromonospora umidemergens TaxID=629679 RepID=A0ABP8WFC4_9MICO